MFTLDFYSAVSSIVTGPLSFLYVVILTLEWRFSDRVMRVLIPGFLILLSAGSAVYFAVQGVNDSTKLHTAIFAIEVFIVFNLLASRYPLLQIISTYTTACLFTFISDTVCGVLVPGPGLLHVLAKVFIYLSVAVFLLYFIRRPLLEVQREIQKKRWLWMMIVPLMMCPVFFYVVQMQGPLYEEPAFRPVALALCFCALSVYIAFYFVLRSLQKQYQMESETAILRVHLSSLKKHADTMKSMSDQMRLIRHDLRHYVHIQSICLENGDTSGMREALESISRHIDGSLDSHWLRPYTGQTLIDAVLSFYTDQAESAGIIFNVSLDLPEELGDTSELAVMLANAVENACNACLAMERDKKREIRLKGGVAARQFLLEVSNTYSGEVRFDGKGRPASLRMGHGYGTQSIVSYAETHNAQLFYQAENGWFSLRFIMTLKQDMASNK